MRTSMKKHNEVLEVDLPEDYETAVKTRDTGRDKDPRKTEKSRSGSRVPETLVFIKFYYSRALLSCL